MGRAGRRRFERLFTAERMVDATLRSDDALQGAIAAPGRPASLVPDAHPEAGYA